MDTHLLIRFIVLILLLILSAFFSSAETALTTVNKIKLKTMEDDGNKKATGVLKVISRPKKMLSAILIGNNIVNLSASSLATTLAIDIFGSVGAGIATGILTLLILIFGEITPKSLATTYSTSLSFVFAPVIGGLMWILTPAITIINFLSGLIIRLFGIDPDFKDDSITEEEIRTMVDVSHKIAPVGDLLRGGPPVQKSLVQALVHEHRIVYDVPVKGSVDASCGDAVAGGSEGGYPQGDIFHVGHNTSLAGGISGKFCPVGGAGGGHEEYGADGGPDPVFFGDGDRAGQIDLDLAAALLDAGIVDQHMDFPGYIGEISGYIRYDMCVGGAVEDGAFLQIQTGHLMACGQIFSRAGEPDAPAGSCY